MAAKVSVSPSTAQRFFAMSRRDVTERESGKPACCGRLFAASSRVPHVLDERTLSI